jgi:5'-3' exonuclease
VYHIINYVHHIKSNEVINDFFLQPNFTILREQITFGGKKEQGKSEGQQLLDAHSSKIGSQMGSNSNTAVCLNPADEWVYQKPLQVLQITVLREYLEAEFSCLKNRIPFGYDFENIVDDFVFLCFFVGKFCLFA